MNKNGIKIYHLQKAPHSAIKLEPHGWAMLSSLGPERDSFGGVIGIAVDAEIMAPKYSDLAVVASELSREKLENVKIDPADPSKIEFLNEDENQICLLSDILRENTDKLIDGTAPVDRIERFFGSPTFVKTPAMLRPLKVEGLKGSLRIEKKFQKVRFKLPDIAVFVMESLDDGRTVIYGKRKQDE